MLIGASFDVQDFMAVNLAHAQLRKRLMTDEKMQRVEERMGKEAAQLFINSGITGITAGKVRGRSGGEGMESAYAFRCIAIF